MEDCGCVERGNVSGATTSTSCPYREPQVSIARCFTIIIHQSHLLVICFKSQHPNKSVYNNHKSWSVT